MNDIVRKNVELDDMLSIRFNDRIQSEMMRERIIHVVCDSDTVNDKISKICEQKIADFNKDATISALTKELTRVTQGVRFWLPFGVSTAIGLVGVIAVASG